MEPVTVVIISVIAALAGAIVGVVAWRNLARQANEARLAAAIETEKARLAAEHLTRLQAVEEQAKTQQSRHRAEAEAALTSERHAVAAERQELAAERQSLLTDRQALGSERQAVVAERQAVANERQAVSAERLGLAELETRNERREAKLATLDGAITARETALANRSDALDRKAESLETRDGRLRERETQHDARIAELDLRAKALDQRESSIADALAKVAAMTRDEAVAALFKKLDDELVAETAARIAKHEKALGARSKEIAVEHVARAIQRYAAEHTAETTATRVPILNQEFKGRIIGKEGRNIKAFEQATGADVVIDESPDYVMVSCFDPVRREMARRTLTILLEDGRIHPGRIEEVMAQVQQELDKELARHGEDAAFRCDVSGLHPQVIKLLGKLHFRTSYGQNVLSHTQEVAFLCGAIAADLGLDPRLGRRCGLLHDLGKAIDHEQEGSHPELGYEALKRYGESEIVANAALAHHEGHEVLSAYTVIAAAADAISAARPGARNHSQENYIQRLQRLEEIACSFPGVQKAFAIQAGRELRVIVNQLQVEDAILPKLARDIAKRIADEVAFPGEVKVNLIRESRHYAIAR
ncbi:ribonuclease Y [Planctomycetota bacterium]|nr:ribonuclease Y [Planctomycetota bacterium]